MTKQEIRKSQNLDQYSKAQIKKTLKREGFKTVDSAIRILDMRRKDAATIRKNRASKKAAETRQIAYGQWLLK